MTALVVESFNCAILDSAFSSTVCGNDWLQSYIHSLSEKEVLKVTEKDSNTTFRFGDGEVHTSMKKVKIPVTIVGKKINIETDVVDCGIPLLLSKKSMKRAKIKIDLENDTAVIFGRRLKLACTSSGHYSKPSPITTFFLTNSHLTTKWKINYNDYKSSYNDLLAPSQASRACLQRCFAYRGW